MGPRLGRAAAVEGRACAAPAASRAEAAECRAGAAVVVAAGAVDKETMMNTSGAKRTWPQWPLLARIAVSLGVIAAPLPLHAQGAARAPRAAQATAVKSFDNPKQAADALLAAATAFDVAALQGLFGPTLEDIVLPGNDAEDRQRAAEFVDEAREKASVSLDPTTRNR